MKIYGKTLALATVVLSLPMFVLAQGSQNPTTTNAPGTREASQMVPVDALLSQTLDARKDHPGSSIQAKLSQSARLSDGTELPSGSMLIGQVVQDDMQQQGMSKLALRFDQARLKDGKVIPIRATIVGIANPLNADDGFENNLAPNSWTDGTLQVDQLAVVPGVDLHSKISSQESGVFVSSKKDDVKLARGSQVQLAVAPARETSAGA